jgi:hypothetical protein
MHTLEPYWRWREKYTAETDELSPFFGREYSEMQYSTVIYDHYIHPQWDFIESPTLYVKILFTDYDEGFSVIELLGEWNDVITNDVMLLKREVIDILIQNGINKFVLIGENLLNIHIEDDEYYYEWFGDLDQGGWIVPINFRNHVLQEMEEYNILTYLETNELFNDVKWRKLDPDKLIEVIEEVILLRLN